MKQVIDYKKEENKRIVNVNGKSFVIVGAKNKMDALKKVQDILNKKNDHLIYAIG